jgi:hypothetical protein
MLAGNGVEVVLDSSSFSQSFTGYWGIVSQARILLV